MTNNFPADNTGGPFIAPFQEAREQVRKQMLNGDVPGYEALRAELEAAYNQSARGKGVERHANNKPWTGQPIFEIARRHGHAFLSGQAEKKLQEAVGMIARGEIDKARHELMGVIVYTAALSSLLQEDKP